MAHACGARAVERLKAHDVQPLLAREAEMEGERGERVLACLIALASVGLFQGVRNFCRRGQRPPREAVGASVTRQSKVVELANVDKVGSTDTCAEHVDEQKKFAHNSTTGRIDEMARCHFLKR